MSVLTDLIYGCLLYTSGHGHGAGWRDLFLSVPQGDVQQVAPLRFGLFFSQNLIANRPTLPVRHLGHRYRDFPCRIGQGGTLAGDGHGDAVFGLRRQGKFLRSLRQVDIAQNPGVVRPIGCLLYTSAFRCSTR